MSSIAHACNMDDIKSGSRILVLKICTCGTESQFATFANATRGLSIPFGVPATRDRCHALQRITRKTPIGDVVTLPATINMLVAKRNISWFITDNP